MKENYTMIKLRKEDREKLLKLRFHPEVRFEDKSTTIPDVVEALLEFWENAHKEAK